MDATAERRRPRRTLGIMSWILALALPGLVLAAPARAAPMLMGALGDSLSAGTLAETHVDLADDPADTLLTPLTIAEIQARHLLDNKATLSWASGQEIPSHFERLSAYLRSHGGDAEAPLAVVNEAVPGGTTDTLGDQVDQLLDELKSGGYASLAYVTLLIGNNDVCSKEAPGGVPPDRMRHSLRKMFSALAAVSQAPPVRILVSSMPDIPQLGRPEIDHHKTLGVLNCSWVRDHVIQYCNELTVWSDEAERQAAESIMRDRNSLLREEAEAAARAYPNLQVAFSDRLYQAVIPPDALAADCFHANRQGQVNIADMLWEAQPWFK